MINTLNNNNNNKVCILTPSPPALLLPGSLMLSIPPTHPPHPLLSPIHMHPPPFNKPYTDTPNLFRQMTKFYWKASVKGSSWSLCTRLLCAASAGFPWSCRTNQNKLNCNDLSLSVLISVRCVTLRFSLPKHEIQTQRVQKNGHLNRTTQSMPTFSR